MSETPETPETVKVKATEVKPYHYGLWCSIEGRDPFTNPIVGTKWSEDGRHVWYMLDTHNFHRADPDEFLDLVPLTPHRYISEKYGDWAIGPRPSEDRCENCDLPRVSDEDAKKYKGGYGEEFCWSKDAAHCRNEPEDWRTRALMAEANNARLRKENISALRALEAIKEKP